MYNELVKRLHQRIALTHNGSLLQDDLQEAADAIEELSHELDSMNEANIALYGALPRWIPVNERLPEENEPCIVYNKYYGPMVGWRVDGERFRIPGSHFPDHPTHWMPPPEPPKEEA